MVFSEIVFLLYFLPVFFAVYYLCGKYLKNLVILLGSILFYAWGAPEFVIIALISIVLNFFIVQWLHKTEHARKKRLLLIVSIVINIGLLAYFKYANFFIDNVNSALGAVGVEGVSWTEIVLPIGISFFTFQSLTYSLDVYRKVHAPLRLVTDYMLYILMFPQMIAGPIVRFNSIADQITERTSSIDDKLVGFYRFCIGLGKKVLIANVMGAKADAIMGASAADILAMDYSGLDSTVAWLGILAYTFQIYFDFSGYSDMAIGLGRMMGFKFPENFDNPYVSRSITEFWKRWHITLGAWMRDYLYIPLGGNRVKSKSRLYFNLWIVFLLSGLWHGASWGFVIWGAFHGAFLILDRLFLDKVLKRIGKVPSVLITFFIVAMGWVIFKIEDAGQAIVYYDRLFSFDFEPIEWFKNKEFFVILIIAAFFSFFTILKPGLKVQNKVFYSEYGNSLSIVMFLVCGALFMLSVASVTSSSFNPFIYFRF